jgi:hypothetical protein
MVNGVQVRCITPEWMVKLHCGDKLDENDYHDVKALCGRFGIKYNGIRRFRTIGFVKIRSKL